VFNNSSAFACLVRYTYTHIGPTPQSTCRATVITCGHTAVLLLLVCLHRYVFEPLDSYYSPHVSGVDYYYYLILILNPPPVTHPAACTLCPAPPLTPVTAGRVACLIGTSPNQLVLLLCPRRDREHTGGPQVVGHPECPTCTRSTNHHLFLPALVNCLPSRVYIMYGQIHFGLNNSKRIHTFRYTHIPYFLSRCPRGIWKGRRFLGGSIWRENRIYMMIINSNASDSSDVFEFDDLL
jgi:hypothetical protein